MLRSVGSYQGGFNTKLLTFTGPSSHTSIKEKGCIYQRQCITVFVRNVGVRLKEQPKHAGAGRGGGGGGALFIFAPPALSPSPPLTLLPLPTFMFTGVTCEIQIDECQSQPCLNGGRCHDDAEGFACICLSGFQGHRCEINTDECQEQPCRNGAPCVDGVNG